jgi:hypothetical protein
MRFYTKQLEMSNDMTSFGDVTVFSNLLSTQKGVIALVQFNNSWRI